MTKKVFEIHQSGNDYKSISKDLELQRTSVRAIIRYWGKKWKSGEPSQEWQVNHNYPKSEAMAQPQGHKRTPKIIQRTLRLVSILPRIILMIPETFGKILCGLMRHKMYSSEGVCPVTSGVKVILHFRKRTS